MTEEEFIKAFYSAPDAKTRQALMDEHTEFVHIDTVQALKEQADLLGRDDAHKALAIGLATEEMAARLASDEAHALALWAQAYAYDSLAEFETAVQSYERTAELFRSIDKPLEAARVSIGQMFTLMKLGQLDRVQSLAESARAVFVEQGDVLSQAKIDMNLGSLHYQQGQYLQALASFREAAQAFQSLGNNLYAAMNQVNEGNVLTLLDDFREAERLHEQARPVLEDADLRAAVASVDHDLAILHYARGNYAKAFHIFERARDVFINLIDQANIAQTDLEESDLYLDLNLPEEAKRLSEQAEQVFSKRGMSFELARGRANHAVALARMGEGKRAAELLEEAHTLFTSQDNTAWVAHIDLQRAEVIGRDGQHEQARHLVAKAAQAYETLGMKTKQAYAHIVSANLWADEQQWDRALKELETASGVLTNLAAPWLEQRIDTCRGRIYEGKGQSEQAIEHYKKAAGTIEEMTAALTAEEHRTAFVADKLAPYEALVSLYGAKDPSAAFQWAEQAKSRALVDMLAAGIRPRLHISDEMDARRAERLGIVREELNWLYTRLTRGTAPGESGAPAAGPETWTKIEEREREATSLWRDLQGRHPEDLSLIRAAPLAPEDIQTTLPEKTVLLEFFIARGQVTAFVISKETVLAYPAITSLSELLILLENLAFQFSKFAYGPAYYHRHRVALLKSTQEILKQLGQKLIAPFQDALSTVEAVIIIPHGPLHALPFHALRLNERYLIETHTVSYAPSAAVLKFCWNKPTLSTDKLPFSGTPLLVGVPDERAHHVTKEIQELAKQLGGADVLLGEKATFEQMKRSVVDCGVFHLAAHGLFRPEAPLLSSIRLADRWLAVQDIYDLEMKAALVVLSACETGLGHDAGGDDMVGLVRGFLHAGVGSLIVSLWVVDDESMTRLVTDFYTRWLAGRPKAKALRQAQLDLMKDYEHPYFWAPLVLVGNEK
ncbi:MAG: CHAT domain-containing protein [Anaerolineae bacterium]|nr:CHAT domain-containing protein [Anaerolineae bacterium]